MRENGVLLPIFSLPSKYGVGCFSKEAYKFVDFLYRTGQSYWQILPLGPTSYGDSPYQSYSTYAGNPYFIDLEELIKEHLLTRKECNACEMEDHPQYINYAMLYNNRIPLLRKAFARFDLETPEFVEFCQENAWWLEDYSLFMAVKAIFGGQSWDNWADDIRYRWDNAMYYYRENYKEDMDFYKFLQYKFAVQWKKLKSYANEKGIKIIGDIPIYCAYDSADVWAHPELFQFDEERKPVGVAGCPPDGFSADGQLWGNPLYRWEQHENTGFDWWVSRVDYSCHLYDAIRIDHFRGFDEYYFIPYGDKTARNGHWEKGPGMKLFDTIKQRIGEKQIIAEDLGLMTPTVRKLVKDSGFPGMKVLLFAFDADDELHKNEYLPHNVIPNCVYYTGTHDNETMMGWLNGLKKAQRKAITEYFFLPQDVETEVIGEVLLRMAVASVSDICIIPFMDLVKLGNEARINFPSTTGNNWKWRMSGEEITKDLEKWIIHMMKNFGRFQKKELPKKEKKAEETK